MNSRVDALGDRVGFNYLWSQVDRSVVGGIIISSFLVLTGVLAAGNITSFFDLGSIFIVVGGTFGATLVHYSLFDLRKAYAAFKEILVVKDNDPIERIVYLVELAKIVRREGTLVLENEAESEQDSFLAKGLTIVADGQSSEEIKRVLENELRSSLEGQKRAIQVFNTLGSFAPSFGFIGTLIGLVALLKSLNNPSTVGPAMAIALITTLYGALLANLVFLPIAGKLRVRGEEELLVKQITIEAMLCLSRQENPLIVEQRLQSFLPIVSGR